MRRIGNLWPAILSFENLVRAARRAALGKRRVAGVARFLADLEPNVLGLQRELEEGIWRPGQAYTFEIHDPKTRTITAAPFANRVVHHALIDVLEPHLERRMLSSRASPAGAARALTLRCAMRDVCLSSLFSLWFSSCCSLLFSSPRVSAFSASPRCVRVAGIGAR